MRTTEWEQALAQGAQLYVRFSVVPPVLVSYSVLLATQADDGQWHTVRVYDNAHDQHEMHRYTRRGGKQPGVVVHHGSANGAMRDAISSIRHGFEEMITAWQQ
jgi:hypothetical protein